MPVLVDRIAGGAWPVNKSRCGWRRLQKSPVTRGGCSASDEASRRLRNRLLNQNRP
jgi:hypothetical protein